MKVQGADWCDIIRSNEANKAMFTFSTVACLIVSSVKPWTPPPRGRQEALTHTEMDLNGVTHEIMKELDPSA